MDLDNIKIIDLFAGAGGFSLGFSQAGFNIAGALERQEKFAKTHILNFKACSTVTNDVERVSPSDFKNETGINRRDDTIIIGGPPCQTFSTIGTPKINSLSLSGSKDDPRNYLYKHFFAYVAYYKPLIFIMENVPTLKTKYHGKLFVNILDTINEMGYVPHEKILSAVHYGVPQTRRRLFITGTLPGISFKFPDPGYTFNNGARINGQLDLLDESRNLHKARTVYDAISDLPNIHDGIREGLMPYSKSSNLTSYQHMLRNKNGLVGNNVCRVSNVRAKKVFSYMSQGDKYMDLPENTRKILPFREDIFHDRLKRLIWSQPSWTVLAHIGMDGYMYIHPQEDRTLSVREAARIQSYPDRFEFIGNMREQYVQVGNSVPPLLAEQLAIVSKESLNER